MVCKICITLYGKGTARTVLNTEYGGVHNKGSDLYTYITAIRLGPKGAVQSMVGSVH